MAGSESTTATLESQRVPGRTGAAGFLGESNGQRSRIGHDSKKIDIFWAEPAVNARWIVVFVVFVNVQGEIITYATPRWTWLVEEVFGGVSHVGHGYLAGWPRIIMNWGNRWRAVDKSPFLTAPKKGKYPISVSHRIGPYILYYHWVTFLRDNILLLNMRWKWTPRTGQFIARSIPECFELKFPRNTLCAPVLTMGCSSSYQPQDLSRKPTRILVAVAT